MLALPEICLRQSSLHAYIIGCTPHVVRNLERYGAKKSPKIGAGFDWLYHSESYVFLIATLTITRRCINHIYPCYCSGIEAECIRLQ